MTETIKNTLRELHITMGVTCVNCKYAERCNDAWVWCRCHSAGLAKNNDNYCQDWEEK